MPPNVEIWLDNQLSPILAKWLSEELNLVVKSSFLLGFKEIKDFEIYTKAKKQGNVILVSKDADLEEIVTIHGSPPKLISLKIPNCSSKKMFNILKKEIPTALKLLNQFNKDIIEISNQIL